MGTDKQVPKHFSHVHAVPHGRILRRFHYILNVLERGAGATPSKQLHAVCSLHHRQRRSGHRSSNIGISNNQVNSNILRKRCSTERTQHPTPHHLPPYLLICLNAKQILRYCFFFLEKSCYLCTRFSEIDRLKARRDGRVVDYNGLENRRAERHRGFESLSLRGFPKFGTSKTLILNGLAFFSCPMFPNFSIFCGNIWGTSWEHFKVYSNPIL